MRIIRITTDLMNRCSLLMYGWCHKVLLRDICEATSSLNCSIMKSMFE